MNNELRNRWVTALRSGKYEQGRGALRRNGARPTFCCLGVLCEVVGLRYSAGTVEYYAFPSSHGPGTLLNHQMIVGDLLQEIGVPTAYYLAKLNDQGFTFDQIANFIEQGVLADPTYLSPGEWLALQEMKNLPDKHIFAAAAPKPYILVIKPVVPEDVCQLVGV